MIPFTGRSRSLFADLFESLDAVENVKLKLLRGEYHRCRRGNSSSSEINIDFYLFRYI